MARVTAGILLGGGMVEAYHYWEHRNAIRSAEVYELKGQYYQVLGHAWDHKRKDFGVVYRPLYHCGPKPGSFEAHVLASSHFERWESKFTKVDFDDLDHDAQSRVLPGPFVGDDLWDLPLRTRPIPGADPAASAEGKARTVSGHGTRSHHKYRRPKVQQ
eukprot:TRINITY_DN7176_c0_g1_i1.p1 TRINITY_DN7176_c0_g1~~TRINITY_DN7176_c0_g1_i1.p1  ORF type:complete len:159 (+),score=30.48 TRINITY_DN7176_c0_g1_i1:49-525(+)